MSEFLDLLTQMCLQNLIQYGESIDREAILQAQNQKSGSSSKLATHQSMIEFNNWGLSFNCIQFTKLPEVQNPLQAIC